VRDLKSLDEARVLGAQIRTYLESLVPTVPNVPPLGTPLEIPTADISKWVLGEPENPDDKQYMQDYRRDQKELTHKINGWFNDHSHLKIIGSRHRAKVQIPWGLPSSGTIGTSGTIKLGKDGDYDAELIFPFKIALKARKETMLSWDTLVL